MKLTKSALSLLLIFASSLACNMPGSVITPTTPPETTTPSRTLPVSISGTVWHDLCAVPDGPIPNPFPAGCVASGSGGLIANGLLEAGDLGGDNGEIQYQFFARDTDGNEVSYLDGNVLGIPLQFCP